MRLHSVKMVNYRSISGLDHNEIIVEPNITAIVGKNESGKSNIISGISAIEFFQRMGTTFDRNNINRNSGDGSEITYNITLKGLPEKSELLHQDTVIRITSNSFEATGGIMDYFGVNVMPDFNAFYEMGKNNPFNLKTTEIVSLNQYCKKFKLENS